MWLLSLLVVAVAIPILVASHRYLRPLPMGMTFEGVFGNSTTSESVVKCVDTWAADPPKALVFNEKTKSCTAFRRVYGTKKALADERGYLVTVLDEDVCFKSAMEDIEMIYNPKCREGWTDVSFLSTTACYLVVDHAANYTEDARFDVCEDLYPYSKPASIHSAAESNAVYNAMRKSWLSIALICTDPTRRDDLSVWKWVDGTELDYHNLSITGTCSSNDCLSPWISGAVWYTSFARGNNRRFILCKYNP